MPVNSPLEYIVIFILGTGLGSFLNVVIYRVPRGESIVKPPSHCPQCDRRIRPWENIPLFSFAILGGKCGGCGAKISWQYPVVEAAMGVLLALLLWRFGWGVDLILFGTLAGLLLALSVIDIRTMRLPNPINLAGAILAVGLTLLLKRDYLLEMILGGLVGGGLLVVMGLIGRLLFRKNTLGMGDIKLTAMAGLFLGPGRVGGMFILAIFAGALIGGALLLMGGKGWGRRIPFGPYLALGALLSLLYGREIWEWYISLALR